MAARRKRIECNPRQTKASRSSYPARPTFTDQNNNWLKLNLHPSKAMQKVGNNTI